MLKEGLTLNDVGLLLGHASIQTTQRYQHLESSDVSREFPKQARHEAGFQLDRVQRGLDPFDWKPMSTVGSGVREIRVRDESGAYRVLYVVKFEDAVYVLHCFQKKTQATPKHDIDLAERRYRELLKERR